LITEQLTELVTSALERARADGLLDVEDMPVASFERPKRKEHGDWATNIALAVGKTAGGPRAAAEAIAERMPDSEFIEKVEVAGPGFLNFYLSPVWLHDVVRRAADSEARFGMAPLRTGQKINVEYVSANPTGPINVVSGRHAAVGDALSNLLEATGHEIAREFYANDAGRQVDLFAESLEVRYLQALGREAELPEDGYQGEYMIDLGRDIASEEGDRFAEVAPDERRKALRQMGLERMMAAMKESLARFGTSHDVWFSEQSLHASEEVEAVIDRLRTDGWIFERDGAHWFGSSRLGDDKDRVVVRANGETTYLASDLAYLIDKFSRGFDHLIYLWGADHHGTIARLMAGVEALGFDRSSVEIDLVQIVTLLRRGEAVKASKRAGVLVPLDELVDEVGVDAARYTFLSRSMDAPLDFDIELAKEQDPENPVYYVQYAHARICSILRRAGEQEATVAFDEVLRSLVHPSEDELMRKLAAFEQVVPEAAEMRAPQRITRYLEELASVFSAFYRDCRVVSDDEDLTKARLALCLATKGTIASGLRLLGVSAPESM
jgi:arginyl-tRNA synthetase